MTEIKYYSETCGSPRQGLEQFERDGLNIRIQRRRVPLDEKALLQDKFIQEFFLKGGCITLTC